MHDFDDIRPYLDEEVGAVISTLRDDREFAKAMASFKFSGLYQLFPAVMTRLAQLFLRWELKGLNSIHDVQIVIEKYLDNLIEKTTTGLTHDGLSKLNSNTSYLFVSNHRDITMDPALVNYMLYHGGFDTLQIAIGDNLLKRPFLSDLMRLNKSFLVKRSLQGREMLAASKQLSAYILHCIETGENVWIAQREGRAKDGIDKTEPAIIKMLHLAGRSASPKKDLRTSINALNIVPVSISYEYDPCDHSKAEELYAKDETGKFEKSEDSDVQSILKGMVGNKGGVHVSFGSPIVIEEEVSADQVVSLIDQQILSNYKLHAVNYFALEKINDEIIDASSLTKLVNLSDKELSEKRIEFEQRLEGFPVELQPYVLNMYANPVIQKNALSN